MHYIIPCIWSPRTRKNESTVRWMPVGDRDWLEGDMRELSAVKLTFYILMEVPVIRVYAFVTTCWTTHLRYMWIYMLSIKFFYKGQAVNAPRSEASWEYTPTVALDLIALGCKVGRFWASVPSFIKWENNRAYCKRLNAVMHGKCLV